MAWETSDRRARLPSDWYKIRQRVLKRDRFRCQVRDESGWCAEEATDVDHIRRGDDHRMENLRSICQWHHRKKSSQEGAAAAVAKRREISARFRREERHPGYRED